MPWIEGGLPVTIDTLLGHVKLGMTHWATILHLQIGASDEADLPEA
jgi:hypothetical protein